MKRPTAHVSMYVCARVWVCSFQSNVSTTPSVHMLRSFTLPNVYAPFHVATSTMNEANKTGEIFQSRSESTGIVGWIRSLYTLGYTAFHNETRVQSYWNEYIIYICTCVFDNTSILISKTAKATLISMIICYFYHLKCLKNEKKMKGEKRTNSKQNSVAIGIYFL